MNAVILSAGQGKRLLPLTANKPKCLLSIEGQSIIEWQIDELAKSGIDRISVVVGYHADRIEQLLHKRYGPYRVEVIYNPTYSWADNLLSCWVAREEMGNDFVLLNGDTLFESAVLRRLMNAPVQPVTVVTHKKPHYDADDMKVSLQGDRLVNIGKKLAADKVDAESIGMILFREKGPLMFRKAVEKALQDPSSIKKWYLSVIAGMAQSIPVWTISANGLKWCEVDFPADLKQASRVVRAIYQDDRLNGNRPKNYAWG